MKIKEKPKAKKKSRAYYAWLDIEEPRKQGRLSQLAKHNRRIKSPSEFIKMAVKNDTY